MARRAVALLLLLWAALACGQYGGGYPFLIKSFDAEISIGKDSLLRVKETISVEFQEPRRGIFRKIPFLYETNTPFRRQVALSDIQVKDESGRPLTTLVTSDGAYLNIRIGDEDVTFPPGTNKTYVIAYTVTNAFNWFDKRKDWEPQAELYWNVTGNDWDTEIQESSFKVSFPETDKARAKVLTGYTGSSAQNYLPSPGSSPADPETFTSIKLSQTEFSGQRKQPLIPGEGLTIVFSVPDTVVPHPDPLTLASWWIWPNSGFLIPVLILAVMLPIWYAFGKDPKLGPVGVEFEPPDGLGPAECGALIDERVDNRDVSAAIVSLAAKGCLTLSAEKRFLFGTDPVINVVSKKPTQRLTAFEDQLLAALGPEGSVVTRAKLVSDVGVKISRLKEKIFDDFVGRGYYHLRPDMAKLATFIGGGVLLVFLFIISRNILHGQVSLASSVIGGALGAGLVISFASIMPRRTQLGARARHRVAGFYEAMKGRRSYLEWVAEKEIAQARYEELLPYAVAFGLVDRWSDTFKEVVQSPPVWWVGPRDTTFSPVYFANSLDSTTRAIGSAATTVPRSESSSGGSGFGGGGGGGFSGGGFGGGGGGSW
ncbi:MAG: DUF2207 domain-containing protein [Fimbriimonadaceae bacterium]|nr:DUF2207 domain-containing protein [Fimbriimonadaceae bacterium]QYK56865.1 MAG: DUF2207 domain-containing protein [Fimbriimonadaceae bacterium]